MKMIKQAHLRQMSVVLFLMLVLLSACTSNSGSTTTANPSTTSHVYSSPSWWNGKTCDQEHYPEGKLLTTWRGLQVCGPIPWKTTGNKDVLEDFHGHGASQYEFECPELIARYLLAAYGLDSQQADGWQVVNAYTSLPGTPFHKVVNDGSIHMAPVEGDVLSYGPSDPGHTSIVTNSNVDGNGNGTIGVIEQNVTESGTAMLTITNWVIQHDANHIGTVASWMTTRPISSQSSTPTPTPPTPVLVPTPTPPPTLEVKPGSFVASDPNICPNDKCEMTLSSPNSNAGNIDWKATITIRPGAGTLIIGSVSPSSGTLAPGQTITVTFIISSNICGDITGSTITFAGGVSPVVVQLSGSFGPC